MGPWPRRNSGVCPAGKWDKFYAAVVPLLSLAIFHCHDISGTVCLLWRNAVSSNLLALLQAANM